ncbi:nucleotidyltransferase domain-containing protein [Fibrella aquatica]|jgi:uncharacterized protein|uniref:nucleotidyltransferase domain-containing protein n=1 Tax=Fibrella aquatica TaxID=3242487 RepID=UPI0035220A82
MNYGLAESDVQQFSEVFRKYNEVKQVTLFGSRAMNTQRPGSDIDLALSTSNLPFARLLDIASQLDELEMFYSFDVVDMNRLTNKALIDHIERVGVVIYEAAE